LPTRRSTMSSRAISPNTELANMGAAPQTPRGQPGPPDPTRAQRR
jgi:hypothetical protein